jgi:hypothetical protein
MLKLIDAIKHEQTKRLISEIDDEDFFDEIRCFYELLAQEAVHLGEIVASCMPLELKVKLLVYRKLSVLAPRLVKLKWLLDKGRKVVTQPRRRRIINNKSRSADHVKSEGK